LKKKEMILNSMFVMQPVAGGTQWRQGRTGARCAIAPSPLKKAAGAHTTYPHPPRHPSPETKTKQWRKKRMRRLKRKRRKMRQRSK
jgi:hypothetical protein